MERQGFKGIADDNKATHYNSYRIFNDPEVRNGIIKEAQNRYGYSPDQMGICLFVGKFRKGQEKIITEHLSKQNFIVYNLRIITEGLLKAAQPKTYLNDPVIVTIKALDLAGLLRTSID